jgi:PAS domain S-box-containing protein
MLAQTLGEASPLLGSQAQSELLRLCIEAAPVGIAMFDRQMRYLAASRRFREDLGVAEQELTGRSHYDVFPEIHERWRETHRRCLAGASDRSEEDSFRRADGTVGWYRWRIEPWRDANGEVGGIVLFSEEISRERAEREALAEAAARFQMLANSLPVSITSVSKDLNVRYANRTAAEWLGRSLGEVIGNKISSLNPAMLRADLQAQIGDTLAGESSRGEVALRFPDGKERWCEVIRVPDVDASGEIRGYYAISIDQSARHAAELAELARHEAEARLRLLVDNLPALIANFDRDLRIRQINEAGARWLGQPASTLVGQRLVDIALKFDRKVDLTQRAALTFDGRPSREEVWITFPDGVRRWCDITRVPETGPKGESRGYFVLITDATERVRSRQLLAASEARFGAFMDAIPAATWIKDSDGRYIYLNQAWDKLTQRRREDWIGKTALDILPPDAATRAIAHDAQVLETGQPVEHDYEAPGPDGLMRHWRSVKFPIPSGSGQPMLGVISFDVTRQKRLERQLQESATRTQMVVRAGNVGLWDWDLRTNKVFFSSEWKSQIGYADHEIAGDFEEWRSRVHPDDLGPALQAVNAYVEGRSPVYEVEFRLRHKDGSYRWILATASLTHDPDGKPARLMGTHTEITRRMLAEQKLLESETRFRLLMDNLPALIASVDSDLRVQVINRTGAAWLAEPAESIVGRKLSDYRLGVDGTPLPANVPSKFDGKFSRSEIRYSFPDGVTRWVDITRLPQFDDTGRLQGYYVLSVDITDRKKAQENLAASEARFSAFMDALPAISVIKDAASRYVYLNETASRLFGRGREESIGRTAHELFPDLNVDELTQNESDVLRTGQTFEAVAEVRLPQGRQYWRHLKFPVDGGGERLVGVISFDVTRQRELEIELETALAQYRLVTENLPAMIVRVGPDFRVRFANRVTQQWYGRPADQIVGQTLNEIYGRDRSAEVSGDMIHVLAGETTRAERRILFPDGVERWCDHTGVPEFDEHGKVVGYFAFGIDVSDRKRAEEHLQQSLKMEAVGQLTGGIAHDFNNLLMVIGGNLSLIAKRMAASSKDRGLLDAAQRATQRGADLTKRLLAFSRRMPLQPDTIDVNHLAADGAKLFKRTLGEAIYIETRLAASPGHIFADPSQLQNALLNLVINARDAMTQGGRIVIATERVDANSGIATVPGTEMPAGDCICLSVTDTGSGIAPDIVGRVFEPFFTTKTVGKGSGLGLSMVYGFVKQSGGAVAIESAPGRGTTVSLYFPAVRAADEATASETEPAHVARNDSQWILVVEDDDDVREVVIEQVTALGYRVRGASNGAAAIEVLRSPGDIDILLTDVVMPGGMNGLDVARAARALRPRLAILCMSGYTDSQSFGKAIRAEGIELLAKPFTEEELAAALLRAKPRQK